MPKVPGGLIVNLDTREWSILETITPDPDEYVNNFVKERIRVAGDDLLLTEIAELTKEGKEFPATRNGMIDSALKRRK